MIVYLAGGVPSEPEFPGIELPWAESDFPGWWLVLAIGAGFAAWFAWRSRRRAMTPAIPRIISGMAAIAALVSTYQFVKHLLQWFLSPFADLFGESSVESASSAGSMIVIVVLILFGIYLRWANHD